MTDKNPALSEFIGVEEKSVSFEFFILALGLTSRPHAGHGDSNSRNIPTLVKDISNVGEVSCGSSHTIALSKDGRTVWSFGGGDNGEAQKPKQESGFSGCFWC